MFRIAQHPSSGSYIQYLTKITDNGSIVQVCYVRCQCYDSIYRHNTDNVRNNLHDWTIICNFI
jgi:hypothetical protein